MSQTPDSMSSRISGGLYNDILAGILVGEYPQHSVLPPETQLARDYGVSRTVVRLALERLKQDGVVESRQGSGTVVAAHDPRQLTLPGRDAQMSELRECYACRLAVEPYVARTVASTLTQSAAEFLNDQRVKLASKHDSSEHDRWVQDARFHIRLTEFSGNRFFISLMKQLRPHMLFAMNATKTLNKKAHESHVVQSRLEHLEVIETILNRNPIAAHAAMQRHIENGAQRMFSEQKNLGAVI